MAMAGSLPPLNSKNGLAISDGNGLDWLGETKGKYEYRGRSITQRELERAGLCTHASLFQKRYPICLPHRKLESNPGRFTHSASTTTSTMRFAWFCQSHFGVPPTLFGSGYRVYFGEDADNIVVLLCGGDKGSQKKDIKQAKSYWREYLTHEKI
jgi:hypothetical protein